MQCVFSIFQIIIIMNRFIIITSILIALANKVFTRQTCNNDFNCSSLHMAERWVKKSNQNGKLGKAAKADASAAANGREIKII